MIVADQPPESWTDDDFAGFELKLGNLARQFKNLEALQTTVDASGGEQGFKVRRVTVTQPDGREVYQMVWADHQHSEKAGKILGEVLANHALRDNPQLKQALIARFAEEASKTDSQDEIAEAKVKRARRSSRQTQVRVDIS